MNADFLSIIIHSEKFFFDSSSKLEETPFANRIKTAQTKIQGEEERKTSY